MQNHDVLVIGAGISGITSALEAANAGLSVCLIEKEATIGGHVASFCCKATDVCTNCSVCLASQKISEVVSHPQITILADSTVTGISGKLGSFRVEALQKPQYVSPDRCIACGVCAGVCPAEVKAIKAPAPQSSPYSYAIEGNCLRLKGKDCDLCRQRCPTNAIDFMARHQKQDLSVKAIVVATGFEVFDARTVGPLGYGRCPNVLTGADLEKVFNAEGSLRLPSNGKQPQRIAFIQCVGSRSEERGYCSQVCCKYAMRFARLIKHQNQNAEVTVFYIDLQTAGKGFAEFYEECKGTIRFVRGVPVEIIETGPGKLQVKFESFSEGKVQRELFDLVVLSVGMVPRKESWDLTRILGTNLGQYGFFDTQLFDPTKTSVRGVFLAGACEGPKDIGNSIAHGTAAAKMVIEALA